MGTQQRDDEDAKREQLHQEELAETKIAMGNDLARHTKFSQTMPGGARLALLKIPVKPEHDERKKGWQVVLVKLANTDQSRYDDSLRNVTCDCTYTNGNAGGFPSCSTTYHATDEDALWEVVNHVYQNWH